MVDIHRKRHQLCIITIVVIFTSVYLITTVVFKSNNYANEAKANHIVKKKPWVDLAQNDGSYLKHVHNNSNDNNTEDSHPYIDDFNEEHHYFIYRYKGE